MPGMRLITEHRLRKTGEPSPVWTVTAPGLDGAKRSAAVPGVAAAVLGLEAYRGECVYEKQVTCAGTVRFAFGGASGRARAALDGRALCAQDAPGEAFDAIAQNVTYGAHTLSVAVSGPAAGLIRPVAVEQLGRAYVAALRVIPSRRGRMWTAQAVVTVRSLSDRAEKVDVEISVGPAGARWEERTLPPGGEISLTKALLIPGVAAWTPDRPALYPAEAVLWLDGEPADDLCDRVGFRECAVTDGRLALNGKPLFLYGAAYREEWPGLGAAVPLQGLVRDVSLLKAAGLNLLCLEGPGDPRLLDLCDREGLLVLTGGERAAARDNHPCALRGPGDILLDAAACGESLTAGLADRAHDGRAGGVCFGPFAGEGPEDDAGLVDALRRPRAAYSALREQLGPPLDKTMKKR